MILFFEYGRLGNQLFQYCGLKQFFPNHKLVLLGCEDLQCHFDNVEARFISKSAIGRWISFGLARRIIFFLAHIRIFGLVTEDKDSTSFKLVVRNGFIRKVLVPHNVFFQHQDICARIENSPVLKPHTREEAVAWLRAKGISTDYRPLVFVHIRRGDYLNWPSKEFPAVLDLGWYKLAMDAMRQKYRNSIFILMGDDQYYLSDVFEESEAVVISNNSPELDLGLMTLCHSGILSASSFAWWGAFYARREQKRGAQFLAPRYWAGHRVKKWAPANFQTNWITYIE